MGPFILPLIDIGAKLLDRLIPDPEQKAQAQLALLKMQQDGELEALRAELQLSLSQAQTNTTEATSANLFVSGWRPFIGWVCGIGLSIQFIVGPLGTWAFEFAGMHIAAPALDVGTLMTLLFGMLGLGAYRTFEKVKGVAVR